MSVDLLDRLNQEELEQIGRNIQKLPPKSQFIEIDGIGKIDKSIATLITFLNKKGYITLASCSGLQSEHDKNNISKGYISFDTEKSGNKLNKIIKIASNLGINSVELGDCFFRNAITIRIDETDDRDLKEQWTSFYNELLLILE